MKRVGFAILCSVFALGASNIAGQTDSRDDIALANSSTITVGLALPQRAGALTSFLGERPRTVRRLLPIPDCLEVELIGFRPKPDRDEVGTARSSTAIQGWEERVRLVRTAYMRKQNVAIVDIDTDWPNNTVWGDEFELSMRVTEPTGPRHHHVGPMQAVAQRHFLVEDQSGDQALTGMGHSGLLTSSSGQVVWCTGNDWRSTAESAIQSEVDYLIVMADALSDSLVEELATHRADENGLNVAIAKLSQIDQSPNVDTTPDTLRSFIKKIYV